MDDWLYSVSLSRDSKSQEVDTDLVHDTIGLGGWQSTSVEEFSDQWELVLRQGDGEVEKDELFPIKGHGYEHDASDTLGAHSAECLSSDSNATVGHMRKVTGKEGLRAIERAAKKLD